MTALAEPLAPPIDGADPGDDALTAWLVEHRRIADADLERAARLQADTRGATLPAMLLRLGVVGEQDVAQALAKLLGLPLAGLMDYPTDAVADIGLSVRFMREFGVLPIRLHRNGTLELAMTDPRDEYAHKAVSLATGRPLAFRVGLPTDIDDAIERLYGEGRSAMDQIVENLSDDAEGIGDDVDQLRDMASEAPVIRLVNLMVQRAVEAGASDIHIEPFEDRLKIRYRIDGVLRDVESPPARSTAAVISRVKIMARLNIAERRLPQDGRIRVRVQGRELDLRVSCIPTMHGESVVMRLLDREAVVLDFDALGFDGEALRRVRHALARPNGIILVTGPTGSGKTTTLYTALDGMNSADRKIITVEDPVEYQLEGINQIQVKPSIGLNFAQALRSIVRQDPDVIMIGEMRDLETARIAIQSALTGHLVLSTLHTNDAAGGVTRLLDMGVEDYLLVSTVNAIVGQRLVRRLCPHCREPYEVLAAVVDDLNLRNYTDEESITLYRPVGCEACGGNGYRGRLSIVECLVMTDALRSLVLRRADAGQIDSTAREGGMTSMYEDGVAKALRGLTTVEEVLRVTQES